MRKHWQNPAPATEAPAGARVPESFQIGPVRIAPATVLAPMAGITDTVFRRFIRNVNLRPADDHLLTGRESGCGLIMTEFTSADGVLRSRDMKAKRYLHFYPDEHPISAQLFGSNVEVLRGCGCHDRRSRLRHRGPEPGLSGEESCEVQWRFWIAARPAADREDFRNRARAVTIPFTVKFRAGWSDSEIVCVELAKLAESCGLQAVALHARTREQGYAGEARWEWIAHVKEAVKIPVIGNGDIRSPEDARADGRADAL